MIKNYASILILLFVFSYNALQAQKDSLNQVDEEQKKQGYWIYTNADKHLPGYEPTQKVEEGKYVNNKKEGKWTFYFNNGAIKHVLHYKNNTPEGEAIFYYKNGKIREQGVWKNNRWVGEYKMYYRNGNLKNHFTYNHQGLKDGEQKYFYENGNLMISGTWNKGSETDDIYEYNEDGTPDTSRYKAGPTLVQKKAESLESPTSPTDTTEKSTTVVKTTAKDAASPFNGNGFHEFKDKFGNKTKVGEFENGLLVDGKIFKYSEKGQLELTKIVKKGSIVKIIRAGQE